MDDIEKINNEIEYVLRKISENLENFKTQFPADQSKDYVYPKTYCTSWTEGFWTGMLWLAFEITDDEKYKDVARGQIEIFRNRIENK